MKSLLTRKRRINPVYLAFMAASFMIGVAGALQAPTLSLFLTREVQPRPFWVGLFLPSTPLLALPSVCWWPPRCS